MIFEASNSAEIASSPRDCLGPTKSRHEKGRYVGAWPTQPVDPNLSSNAISLHLPKEMMPPSRLQLAICASRPQLLDVKFHGAKDRDLSSPSETNWTLSPAAAQQKWALFFRAKSEIWSHCLTSLRKYASRTHSRTGLLATSGSSVPSHEAQNG
ncbi:hypothetical protein KCU99_g126, partial [Aureobasidium melanogenum]